MGAYQRQLSALDHRGPSSGHGVVRPFPGTSLAARPARLSRLGTLAPIGGFGQPMTLRHAQQRRRNIISGLLAVAAVTLLLGGGIHVLRPLLLVHVAIDGLLVAYIATLASVRNAALERQAKVRYLPSARREVPAAAAGEPLLLLQRVSG
jgi:hypothetical protein